jgi:hypothetical protein
MLNSSTPSTTGTHRRADVPVRQRWPEEGAGRLAAGYGGPVAGWGDDPNLDELRRLVYEEGWVPVAVREDRQADTVTIEKDGVRRDLTSDHIAFHRFVEGLREEFSF